MRRVGLTGNIGTGKSTAANILAELGAHVIDADVIVHELLNPGTEVYAEVVRAFGDGIIEKDSKINRRELGKIVFANPERRALLNSLIHPIVKREILRRVEELEKKDPNGIVVVDAALIVETGLHGIFDKLIVVTCPDDVQVKRIMQRNGLSFQEVKARMAAQMPAHEKVKVADYEINNGGSKEETRSQLEEVYNILSADGREERGRPA